MSELRIGISGWRYAGWRGVFYPPGLRQADELAFAARYLNSVEINGSFYSLQRPEFFRRWYEATPRDFVFSVKGSRFITHMKKLRDVETPLANFFASGLLALEDKLGPILWQFPERFAYDQRFEAFFAMLPRDSVAAATLATGHDERLIGRAHTEIGSARPLRYAVEVRSPSAITPDFVDLLRRNGIALVIADTAGRWPYVEDVTAEFVYVRLHGDIELYKSGYSNAAIRSWAERVRAWAAGTEPDDARRIGDPAPARRQGRDVYVYFDNDAKVHAPFDAIALMNALGLSDAMLLRPDLEPKRRSSPRRSARRSQSRAR